MDDPQLEQIEELVEQSKYSLALNAIESHEKRDNFSEEESLTLHYLKSKLYLRKGLNKEGKKIANDFLQKSRELLHPLREIDALLILGRALNNLGEPDSTLELIKKAKKLMKMNFERSTTDLVEREADLLTLEAEIFRVRENSEVPLKRFQKALSIYEKLKNHEKTIEVLFQLGLTYYNDFRVQDLLECVRKAMEISKNTNNVRGMALGNLGFAGMHRLSGEIEKALKCSRESLRISQETNDQFLMSGSLNMLGSLHHDIGELSKVQEYLDKVEELNHITGTFWDITLVHNNRGSIYIYLGELEKALEQLIKSIENSEKINNFRALVISLLNAGEVYSIMGKEKIAKQHLERSINLARKNNFTYGHSGATFTLIRYLHKFLTPEEITTYLSEMEEINARYSSVPYINQQYRLVKAIILKSKGRLVDKMHAHTIFKDISEEPCIHLENTFVALIHLCELLLFELETTNDKTALLELNKYSDKLISIAKSQHAYPYLAEAYLLKSKLRLIDFEITAAQKLLSQAELISKEKGLIRLNRIFLIEEESMQKLIQTWEKVLDQKPSLSEIIKISRIEDLIKGVVQNKLYQNEEEVIAYAYKAQQITKSWNT